MKILIVDDNGNERKFLRQNLRDHGIETVIEAADGLEGLEMARDQLPDMIISDGLMPRMDGFAFLRHVKTDEALKSILFILYSAIYTGSQEIELAASLGAEAFIVKPLGPEELWDALNGIIEKQRTKHNATLTTLKTEEEDFLREYSQIVTTKLKEKISELSNEIAERKKAEEEISQLASIVESSDDAIIGKSLEGIILTWNKGAENIYGYSAAEIKGRPISLLAPPDTRDDTPRILRRIRNGEHLRHYETRRVRKDGQTIHVSLTVSPVRNAAGEIVGASAIARDITDRKDAEKRTRVITDLLKLFTLTVTRKEYLDSAITVIKNWTGCHNVGIRVKDDGTIPFESRTGYNEEFLASEGVLTLSQDQCICTRVVKGVMDPADRSAVTPNGSFYHNNTARFVAELTKNEATRYRAVCMEHGFLSLAVIPIRHREKILGAIHVADESENMVPLKRVEFLEQTAHILGEAMFRFNMEDHLRHVSSYNRSLIEASLDPLVMIGPDGKITDVNAATEAVTGRDRRELVGTDFADYFTEPAMAQSGYRQAFREGSVRDYPLAMRHRDGQVTLVLYNASVFRDEAGAVIGVFAAARDITARTRMEDSLQEQKWFAESLIANSAVATFVLNPQHRVVLWNKACEELTGYRAVDMIGGNSHWKPFYERERQTLADVVIDGDGSGSGIDALFSAWGRSPLVKKGLMAEGWFKNLNGKNRYILFEAVPIFTSKRELTVVIETLHDFTDQKQAEINLRKLNRTLRTLSASNMTLIHAQEETRLLQDICRIVVEVGEYSMVWVGYAEQDARKTIWPMAYAGREEGYLNALPLTCDGSCDCPASIAIQSGQTVITQSIASVPGEASWRAEALARQFASSIALPLGFNDRTMGAINIYSAEPNAFTEDEIRLLTEMAGDLSFGIMSLRTRKERDRAVEERQSDLEKIRRAMEDTIQAMGAMLEMRDPYLSGHQERVAHVAVSIAGEMGLPQQRIEGIHFGSIIHDIGKICVPAEFLNRPGKLQEIEFNFIKTHPRKGYEIVQGIEFPWPVAEMILQHHENLDGSGYPRGLRGDDIILEARILQVADVVEAMATHRPYRPSRGIENALAEITEKSGLLYDPDVVTACVRLFREKGFRLS